jgi:hypothetical protein
MLKRKKCFLLLSINYEASQGGSDPDPSLKFAVLISVAEPEPVERHHFAGAGARLKKL